jgi:hypothetical protein
MPRRFFLSLLAFLSLLWAEGVGGRAEFVGGTVSVFSQHVEGRLLTVDGSVFRFETRNKTVEVPYARIHTLEYGQKVDRRYISALLISPVFLLSKSRKHFLTVGFDDSSGATQALIFRVKGSDVRSVLVGLEARTGRKVVYQDAEAKKAGKG